MYVYLLFTQILLYSTPHVCICLTLSLMCSTRMYTLYLEANLRICIFFRDLTFSFLCARGMYILYSLDVCILFIPFLVWHTYIYFLISVLFDTRTCTFYYISCVAHVCLLLFSFLVDTRIYTLYYLSFVALLIISLV